MNDIFVAGLECKFAENGSDTGIFSGYGAIFGNQDSHGDVILPGAFSDSLAERKSQGRVLPMHVMHQVYGGDGLPVGVWKTVEEDDKGLRVEGKISGMNTDAGRLLYERVKDGALGGLSIGYRVKKNGAVYGSKPGEPKRTLKSVHLAEISLVDDPSNAQARVNEIKRTHRAEMKAAALADPDVAEAIISLETVIRMQDAVMQQSYCYGQTAKDAALLMDAAREAYEALTGSAAPEGLTGWTKGAPQVREFEAFLREEFGLSRSEASAKAARMFKASPRDEGRTQADGSGSALKDISEAMSGFSLPKF